MHIGFAEYNIGKKYRNVKYWLRGGNKGVFVLKYLLKWMCIYELAL